MTAFHVPNFAAEAVVSSFGRGSESLKVFFLDNGERDTSNRVSGLVLKISWEICAFSHALRC